MHKTEMQWALFKLVMQNLSTFAWVSDQFGGQNILAFFREEEQGKPLLEHSTLVGTNILLMSCYISVTDSSRSRGSIILQYSKGNNYQMISLTHDRISYQIHVTQSYSTY